MQDIGLGASLYILTLKSLGMIFLLLTILNIPALYFFYSGDESEFRKMEGINKYFFQFSLGNVGEHRFSCSTTNLGFDLETINLKCDIGIQRQLVSFGISSHKNQECIPRLLPSSFAYKDAENIVHLGKLDKKHGGDSSNITEYEAYMEYEEGCGTILDEETLQSEFRYDL